MNEIKYLKAWILFFLVATVGGFLAGAVIGGIVGFGIGLANLGNPEKVVSYTPLFQILGFIVALPVSFFTFK
jgi:integral membrane sensor domain MASE1